MVRRWSIRSFLELLIWMKFSSETYLNEIATSLIEIATKYRSEIIKRKEVVLESRKFDGEWRFEKWDSKNERDDRKKKCLNTRDFEMIWISVGRWGHWLLKSVKHEWIRGCGQNVDKRLWTITFSLFFKAKTNHNLQ